MQAIDIVRDDIPLGHLKVAPGKTAVLYLDIEAKDTMQWMWEEKDGRTETFGTQLVWTDRSGEEHVLPPDPLGRTSGTFSAPSDLLGARLEWRNTSEEPGEVLWSYHATASFWRRPELFLPAMLPLFLIAAAFYFGRKLDKRSGKHLPHNQMTSKERLA